MSDEHLTSSFLILTFFAPRTGLKATKKLSYADCFAAALAKIRDAELVTGDRDFKAVENDLKRIRWLK